MRCSFCGVNIPQGTGKIYVKKSGKLFYFCSSKCEKQILKLDHKPREVKWTREARKAKDAK
jgi:large subunit ribosomal protein L24e